jgi:peptide/nickel transport system permease protein
MGGITWGYVLRRVGMWLLTILIGTTLIFVIPRLAPGDPVAAMIGRMQSQSGFVENSAQIIEAWRVRFGLDQPIYVQYATYLFNSLRFDLGYSLASFPSRVDAMVFNALPWTVGLLSVATILSFIIGNTIGALMAWDRTPGILKTLLPTTLTFTSIPFFMLGILLIYVFAFGLRWLPPSGAYGRGLTQGFNLEFMSSVAYHAILPAMAIVVTSMGLWAIGMRGMMITTAGEDYMILAQAKGLQPSRIFWLYGVRNSILPQVTALALTLGAIVGGSLLGGVYLCLSGRRAICSIRAS